MTIKHFPQFIFSSINTLTIIIAFVFVNHLVAHAAEPASLNNIINKSSQILLVNSDCTSCITAKVFALEKKDGKWQKVGKPFKGIIGKNGFAKPGEKLEGDGKSPAGIFPLKRTFGYQESMRTKMPYRQTFTDDLWVDDMNAVDYNRWVKRDNTQAASYENMKRADNLYKYGIVIEYNTDPVIKGRGSAIFLHIWRGENSATEGCLAISEDNIIKILYWLDPRARPLIIMGMEDIMKKIIQ